MEPLILRLVIAVDAISMSKTARMLTITTSCTAMTSTLGPLSLLVIGVAVSPSCVFAPEWYHFVNNYREYKGNEVTKVHLEKVQRSFLRWLLMQPPSVVDLAKHLKVPVHTFVYERRRRLDDDILYFDRKQVPISSDTLTIRLWSASMWECC